MIKYLGIDCDASKLKKLLKESDIDGNGTLEFEEFAGLMSSLMSGGGSGGSSKWEKVFKKFDKDGSGSIDAKELGAMIK